MRRNSIILSIAAALGLMALAVSSAVEVTTEGLTITQPRIRATVPTAKVAAGYITIHNHGSEPDRLIGGSVDFAAKVDVHEMKLFDGVMTMRPLADGLVIPAGETVTLKPGADHLMFMKLSEPMQKGEMRTVTLQFEKAGNVEIIFSVTGLDGSHGDHSDHGDSHSDEASSSKHTH